MFSQYSAVFLVLINFRYRALLIISIHKYDKIFMSDLHYNAKLKPIGDRPLILEVLTTVASALF